jgi:glycosyltransferase involved in cell wall biosynthesis
MKIISGSNGGEIEPELCSNRIAKFGSISIVFPAYNEEENIKAVVNQARDVISNMFDDYEIIVVNDGSHDKTGSIIDDLKLCESSLVTIHHETNKGYGATLRSGINSATKELVFFTDSDLQFDIGEIRDLMVWINDNDMVIGYRADRADRAHRRFNAWGWNRLVRLILGLKIRDIDCAFKLFRREVFEDIHLESVGAMINTELLVLARWQQMSIKEVPVNHFPRVAGKQTGANIRVILKAIGELVSMRRKLTRARNLRAQAPVEVRQAS